MEHNPDETNATSLSIARRPEVTCPTSVNKPIFYSFGTARRVCDKLFRQLQAQPTDFKL